MMCMQIEMFHESVIAPNATMVATMVIYGIIFGGMHPTLKHQILRQFYLKCF